MPGLCPVIQIAHLPGLGEVLPQGYRGCPDNGRGYRRHLGRVTSLGAFFFYLNLLLSAGAGHTLGEAVSRAVNRKRGRGLAVIAGIAVALSYLVNIFLSGRLPFGIVNIGLDLLAVALGIYVAVNRLR